MKNNLEKKPTGSYGEAVVIVVDVQKDFCPGGALGVNDGDKVVPPINKLTDWVRDNDGVVVFTRDKHPMQTKHFDKWPVHCVADTPGYEFHPNLIIKENDAIASKGMSTEDDGYSGFDAVIEPGRSRMGDVVANLPRAERTVGNAVERIVRINQGLGKRTIAFIPGIAGDYCVPATAEPLVNLNPEWLDVVWIEDAVKSVDESDGKRAKQALIEAGMYAMTVDEIINGGIVIGRGEQ